MADTYDVIVVGAGSVGVPSAYYLAKRGLRVLLLDRRSAVGQGDNKAAIGGVRATHSDPAKILLCTRSLDVLRTWQEQHGDDVGWKPGGYCFPAYSEGIEQTLQGLLPVQRKFGLVNDWVDAAAVAELVPGIVRDGLRGGTYSPNDGQVSPLLLPVALARHAERLGATIRVGERVTEYLMESGAMAGVKTDRGSYWAPRVVVATGADAAEDGKLLGIEIPVTPDSHEAGITAPLEHFLAPLVVDLRPGPEGKTANFYFGQNHEGQIIFCYTPKELFVGHNRDSLSEFLPILAARMVSLVPRLQHALVRRVWRGLYPMTPDGVPIVSNVEAIRGLTLAVGMCGQGFMLGIGVGQEVAALVVDGAPMLPPEASSALDYQRDFFAGKREALK
ncbi:MAG: FAD-binding oxidoreductase [Deltaproteobacteria bacterium]|nr:FAD-binding oxidoreductase [Deltaproteobacteria bacterium]MBW2537510.1 FAD-binding oxidoreductase [Deltaproteobacteria bacterium]